MPVTMYDILQLEKMKDAKVIAGAEGVTREVCRIATIEKPFSDHRDYSYSVARKGDLYLSKLYVFQGDHERFHGELQFEVETGASGLVVHEDAADFIDEDAIAFADANQLPIIVIQKNYGFAELTYSIIDMIVQDKVSLFNESSLGHLLSSRPEPQEIRSLFEHMNPAFREELLAVYIRTRDNISPAAFQVAQTDLVLKFKGGILCLFTEEAEQKLEIERRLRFLTQRTSGLLTEYQIGVSGYFHGLYNGRDAILEAMQASIYQGDSRNGRFYRFPELGLYRLLVRLGDELILREFRDRILTPLEGYEQDNGIPLLNTLSCFLRTGGNYKKISEELYIHETTARYRMHKIFELLNVGDDDKISFFGEVKAALLADSILKNRSLFW